MLPKIETPTFDFNIPSTGEVKKFRPFLVKEEKVLMLASEGGEYKDMISACEQVVSNCCLEEIDVENLSVFDLQHLFMRLKEKSTGESQDFTLICGGCKETMKYTLQLSDVQVQGLEEAPDNIIKINDDVAIELQYPNARVIMDTNEILSGLYVVTEIKHKINAADYDMTMRITKNGVGKSLGGSYE